MTSSSHTETRSYVIRRRQHEHLTRLRQSSYRTQGSNMDHVLETSPTANVTMIATYIPPDVENMYVKCFFLVYMTPLTQTLDTF